MDQRSCSVDDCAARPHAKGLCGKHYAQQTRLRLTTPCSISGCEKTAQTRGWCPMHYQRWRNNGDPLKVKPIEERTKRPKVNRVAPCTIDGCDSVQVGRGWCSLHWHRWKRLGDPLGRLRGEVIDGKRVCPGCGVDKPLAEFGSNGPKGGRCLECAAVVMRERRLEHPQPRQPKELKNCLACSEAFLGDKRRSAYCSNECRMAHRHKANWRNVVKRRARLRAAFVEAFDRVEIFERDGWICGICSEAIDPALPWPHLMSATLDHVVPVARGGKHERANAQSAHNICNIRKADKTA